MTAQPQPTHQAKPALAVSVALKRDGKYLLVRRANPPAQDMYAFPGGRVTPGETLEQAVLRELEEETGLKAINPKPLATYHLAAENHNTATTPQFILTVFTVEDQGGEPIARDDAKSLLWISPGEIRSLDVPQSMVDCMNLLAQKALKQSQ